jgi:hypothetical protein
LNSVHCARKIPATGQDEALAARILGNWKMVSWQVEDLASGDPPDALGPNPRGYITYTRDRRVIVLVLKARRPTPAALVPTTAEKLELYDSMFAYAGTYVVEAEKVVHHIDMSWNESWTGTAQIRFFRLDGDTLTYVSVMRGGAGFDPNEAGLQPLEKGQDVAALQPPADNDAASSINAMNLENRLGDVETDPS